MILRLNNASRGAKRVDNDRHYDGDTSIVDVISENKSNRLASNGLDDNVACPDELDDVAAPGADSNLYYTPSTCRDRHCFQNA